MQRAFIGWVFGIVGLLFFFPVVPARAAACDYPSQVLDLSHWKETLPTGSKKKPEEILQSMLGSFAESTAFHPNTSCDGVVFRAPVNGVTTSGSGYPRSELREMNGDNLASWSSKDGTHTMIIDEAITAVPKKKSHIVAGQIHNADDDVMVIRLEYPKLFVDINGKTGPTLDANYTLGKRFQVKFIATGGQIKVYYNGGGSPVYTLKNGGSGNYFKAGAYTQSNCSKEKVCDASNYGEVVVYGLAVDHQSQANANFSPGRLSLVAAGDAENADALVSKIESESDAYRENHDGFREQLLAKLENETSADPEKIAWGVYTFLPDITS